MMCLCSSLLAKLLIILLIIVPSVLGSLVRHSDDSTDRSEITFMQPASNQVNPTHVRARRAVQPRQFLGGFMRMFEQAEWDVIFIKMTRVLVNYFTDMGFKMIFGQTGRSLDSAGPFRSLEIMDRLHDRIKKDR